MARAVSRLSQIEIEFAVICARAKPVPDECLANFEAGIQRGHGEFEIGAGAFVEADDGGKVGDLLFGEGVNPVEVANVRAECRDGAAEVGEVYGIWITRPGLIGLELCHLEVPVDGFGSANGVVRGDHHGRMASGRRGRSFIS